MAVEKRDSGMSLSPRRVCKMEDSLGIECAGGFRLISWRIDRGGAGRTAGAFCGDGGKALLMAAAVSPFAHPAVAFALSAAAGGQIRVSINGDERRNQRPTEEHQQRDCNGAAHGLADSVTRGCGA